MGHLGNVGTPLPGCDDRRQSSGDRLQALDPRTRLLAAGAFAGVVILLDQAMVLGTALTLAIIAAWLVQLPVRRTLRQLAAMDGFILIMLLMLPFTTPGQALFQLGPDGQWGTASADGLWLAADIALTANAILLMLLALVGGLDPVVIGHALHRLNVPMALVQLLQFSVRYSNLMHAEFGRIRNAMRARGFVLGANGHSYRSLGYALGMLLVRSLERSERVLYAMKCRGFTGRVVVIDQLRFRRVDAGFAALAGLILSALLLLEWHFG